MQHYRINLGIFLCLGAIEAKLMLRRLKAEDWLSDVVVCYNDIKWNISCRNH